jgi:hypothetical protein
MAPPAIPPAALVPAAPAPIAPLPAAAAPATPLPLLAAPVEPDVEGVVGVVDTTGGMMLPDPAVGVTIGAS